MTPLNDHHSPKRQDVKPPKSTAEDSDVFPYYGPRVDWGKRTFRPGRRYRRCEEMLRKHYSISATNLLLRRAGYGDRVALVLLRTLAQLSRRTVRRRWRAEEAEAIEARWRR